MQPESSIAFSALHACRIAFTSAWAVMSVVAHTTLCAHATTAPSLTMQAPNGVWPFSIPSIVFSKARAMNFASVARSISLRVSYGFEPGKLLATARGRKAHGRVLAPGARLTAEPR